MPALMAGQASAQLISPDTLPPDLEVRPSPPTTPFLAPIQIPAIKRPINGALLDYRDAQRNHYLMNSPASMIPEDALRALTEYVEGISADQLPRRALPVSDPAARARGAQLAADRCGVCHTTENTGSAGSGIPSLNGQYAAYILVTLQDYRLGVRRDAAMQDAAAALNDRQMADLAVFYESLTGLLPARP
ncbi:MAG: c-type cytochrome [Rhodospirillaceae bacterium]|nr:c-type cytochrome [Rhodospirillaceae bacterium]